jgi:hypothetical protein
MDYRLTDVQWARIGPLLPGRAGTSGAVAKTPGASWRPCGDGPTTAAGGGRCPLCGATGTRHTRGSSAGPPLGGGPEAARLCSAVLPRRRCRCSWAWLRLTSWSTVATISPRGWYVGRPQHLRYDSALAQAPTRRTALQPPQAILPRGHLVRQIGCTFFGLYSLGRNRPVIA